MTKRPTTLSLSHLADLPRKERRELIDKTLSPQASNSLCYLMSRHHDWRRMSAEEIKALAEHEAKFWASHNGSLAGAAVVQGWRDVAAAIED